MVEKWFTREKGLIFITNSIVLFSISRERISPMPLLKEKKIG